MARNTHVPADQLEADIRAGTIDTVIVAFSDHQGRLIGKRTDGEFYLDVVVEEGTENCDYLIACDLDDVPIPGFTWASYEQGYGDMRGVVDPTTIRYLPWLESTAIVLVDLVDVDEGSPGRGLAAAHPAAAGRGGGRARLRVDDRQRGRVLRLPGALRRRQRATATATSRRTRRGWRTTTSSRRRRRRTSSAASVVGSRGAGMPVEFSKGEAGRGQHELNLTFQPALEMADINMVFKNAVKEIAAQFGRSVTFMAKPHFDDGGNSCHIHSSLWADDGARSVMPGDGEHAHERRVPLVPRRADGDGTRVLAAVRPQRQQLQAVPARQLGADRRRLGHRQPHARLPRRRARARRCAWSRASPAPTPTPTTPSPPRSPAVCTASRSASSRPTPYHGNGYTADDLPRIPSTYVEAIELWRGSDLARTCFGDDVHHHVLNHAEFEWRAFNASVTDWERHRYFERI